MIKELDWQMWDILASFLRDFQEELTIVAMEFGHDDESAEAIAAEIHEWALNQEPTP